MIFIASLEYWCNGPSDGDREPDTEGEFVLVCEAASVSEVLEKVLPAKLDELYTDMGEAFYTEVYLRGLVELSYPVKEPVLLMATERPLRKEEGDFRAVLLESDERKEAARSTAHSKISREVPFSTKGVPPREDTI